MTPAMRAPKGKPKRPGVTAAPPVRTGMLAERNYLEVRLGGSGGQGVVLMGIILATAGNHDGRHVVQTESYGPEARGGYSRSDVIISDEPIDYPKLVEADLLVALSQEAATAYVKGLRRDGIFIYDSDHVTAPPYFGGVTMAAPLTHLAKEETGRTQTTNVLALGAAVGVSGVVSVESIRAAVLEEVPSGTGELNLKALDKGLALDQAEWEVSRK